MGSERQSSGGGIGRAVEDIRWVGSSVSSVGARDGEARKGKVETAGGDWWAAQPAARTPLVGAAMAREYGSTRKKKNSKPRFRAHARCLKPRWKGSCTMQLALLFHLRMLDGQMVTIA